MGYNDNRTDLFSAAYIFPILMAAIFPIVVMKGEKMENQSELTQRQRAARRARAHRLNRLAMKKEMERENKRVHFGDDYRDKETECLCLSPHDQWHLFLLKHRLTDGVTFEAFDAYGNREVALASARESVQYADYALLVEIDREEYFSENGEYPSW
jgi:hypothetical protein